LFRIKQSTATCNHSKRLCHKGQKIFRNAGDCGQVHVLIIEDKTVHSHLQPFKGTVSQDHKICRNARECGKVHVLIKDKIVHSHLQPFKEIVSQGSKDV
jgi:hypothetical protein